MARRLRINQKKWPVKSNILVRSQCTRQRGHIYSTLDLHSKGNNKPIPCMWKGHEFKARNWYEACEYVHEIDEFITEY